MAEKNGKRGPGRPPGSKNKKDSNAGSAPLDKTQRIERMQAQYDKDRRNVDVIWSITLFALGLFLFFTVVMDTTGAFGKTIHDICMGLFGIMSYVLPFMIILFAVLIIAGKLQHIGGRTVFFSALIFFNMCILNSYRFIDEKKLAYGFSDIASYYVKGVDGKLGGAVGMEAGSLLVKFFGKPGLLIIAGAIIIISVFLVANTPISRFFESWSKKREMRRIMDEMEEAEIAKIQHAVASTATPGADPVTGRVRGAADPAAGAELPAISVQPKKSFWRSIMNGIAKEEEPIRIPDQRSHLSDEPAKISQLDIPEPLSSKRASSGASAPSSLGSIAAASDRSHTSATGTDDKSLPPQKDNSVMEALNRNTLFGRIARKLGVSSYDDDDGDYGYPGRRSDQAGKADQQKTGLSTDKSANAKSSAALSNGAMSENNRKSYGLKDPDDYGHSGTLGLGSPAAAAVSSAAGKGLAAAKAAEQPVRSKTRITPPAPAEKPAAAARSAAPAPDNNSKKAEAVSAALKASAEADEAAIADGFNSVENDSSYELPPVSLLKKPAASKQLASDYQLEQKANLLEKTLNDFGVDAKVLTVTQGASVTRYEVQPATGVKVSSITKLADDIALNLKAKSIRIEAPIPGKAAVGIEVENEKPSPVMIRELIDSDEFREAKSKIEFVVGKDITGNNIVADLKGMPHLLIAGATGSGKSVCVNAIITSFLYKAKPSELKLIMIDPKVVELANYNGIPHMLTPVVTDPRKAARALAMAVEEMDKRYELFAKEGVKDLESYNELMAANHEFTSIKPQVVIIIDELADLMMAAASDVENSICRLAQKARAAGMHLIVATQRPSVDVVTGLIKANIPSRIAFSVASSVDSRTILDMNGAEKLLGKGDMLFSPVGSNKPYRVQGPFISDAETEKLISFVKNEGGSPDYDEDLQSAIDSADRKGSSEPQDELTEDAIAFILKSKQASVSMLQRRFRIGYNRAARIIDEIEEKGIIGPSDGSRPRQLLITEEEYYNGGANSAAAEEMISEISPQEKAELEEKVTGKPHMKLVSGNKEPAATTETADVNNQSRESVPVEDEADFSEEEAATAMDYFNSLPESVQKMILNQESDR